MADEVASLKVLITGDASDLQSAIQKTEAELLGMNKAVAGANKLSETSQKAFNKVTASTKTYRDSVNEAKTALDKQRTAFKDSTDAYKQNTKDITNNIRGLKQQKTALEGAIVSKNDEIKALESSNKAINKNSSEYKNNQKAIQWVKNEQATLKEQYAQVTSDIDKQSTALKKERTARNAARRDLKQYTADYEEMSSHLKDVERQEKALNRQITGAGLKQLGDDLDTITKPLQVGAAAMAAGGVAAVKFAMDYETAFTGVKKTVDGTDAELNKLNKDIRQMALDIPVSATELANLAATGGQLGVGVNDIGKFTETIAAMGVATNLAGEEGASALARIINVTGDTMDNVDRVGSSIVALGNNSATTEREIADMAVRMGKFGNTVGINTANVLGYSAALSSMGIEAQAGGSALGRTWLDIEKAVSSGGAALNAYAKHSGKSASEFKEQWNTDASGAFAGLIKGLSATEDLTGALSELGIQNTLDQQAVMALANNYDMLEKSLSLASSAYEENTALTKEAQAAYATTASQIQMAKNNLVEAAMGFGEILLPEVVDATGGVKGFAESIANMSNAQKQGLITTGKWVIGLGATTKLATGAIKGIGSTMQAIGNIEEAVSAGGALAKFAPTLTKIISAAPYAAAGIAAVGTAVTVGKKAYDAWYDSQYRWSKGLSEGNEAIAESLDKVKELDSIQSQIKDLKLTIENPQSSQEQVNNAKTKLEEIKGLLAEEYNLVINSDNEGLEETVENIKTRSRNELQRDLNDQQKKLNDILPKLGEYNTELANMQEQYNRADSTLTYYDNLNTKIHTLQSNLEAGAISQQKYNEEYAKIAKELNVQPQDVGLEIFKKMEGAQKTLDDLTPKISDMETSIGEAKQAAKGYLEILNQIYALDGENSKIEITADSEEADSVLNGTEQKVKELDGKNVEFSVNADGTEATATINGVTYKVAAYDEATGEAILTADGTSASMAINFLTGEVTAFDELEGIAILSAIDNVSKTAKNAAEAIKGIKDKEVTITAIFKQQSAQAFGVKLAKGTKDAPGGLAMINDERGVSDPRELVEVDGKGYIFEGKDVVLPLPKHAKVYTATQTKKIMSGKGISHYASGKDNEAWDKAQDEWRHYTTVNNVSAAEALAHWDEMLEKFKNDAEVVKEIQEEIVASTKNLWNEELESMQFALDMGWLTQEEYYEKLWKYRDENFAVGTDEYRDSTLKLYKWEQQQLQEQLKTANEISETWVETTNYLDTWEKQGDSMIGAYVRYRDRNLQAVKDGILEEQEAYENNAQFMETMLEGRVQNTIDAMTRETRIWGVATDEQLALLNKVKGEVEDYYAAFGALTDRERVFEIKLQATIDDAIFDVIGNQITNWEQDAALYLRESQIFGWDWKNNGDSEMSYYLRIMDKYRDFLDNGGLNAVQYKEVQTKMREAELDAYAAASTQFDEMLSKKMDEINEMQTTLSDKVSKLREKWTVEDRQEDIWDTKKQLSIYENAVTKEGREEYERLQEQLTQLERDEQIYQMEKENNAIIAQMKASYEILENDKAAQISQILADADAFNVYNMELSKSTSDIEDMLGTVQTTTLPNILTALTDIHGAIVNAVDNLDFDIDINNNINTTEGVDANALVNPLQRVVSLLYGGR